MRIGKREHEVPPLGARRGAKALHILLPYITKLREALKGLALADSKKSPEEGIEIILRVVEVLYPLMEPDLFLDLAAAVIALPVEEIEEAPFVDVATALARAVGKVDVGNLLAASTDVYTQVLKVAGPAEAETPAPQRKARPSSSSDTLV